MALGDQLAEVTIRGVIALPSPRRFDRAVAIVDLEDVTLVDDYSKRIAEVVINPLDGVHDRIPFSLTVDAGDLSPASSYALTAEIRMTRSDELSRGDFLSTAAHPWPAASDREVTIMVQQI